MDVGCFYVCLRLLNLVLLVIARNHTSDQKYLWFVILWIVPMFVTFWYPKFSHTHTHFRRLRSAA